MRDFDVVMKVKTIESAKTQRERVLSALTCSLPRHLCDSSFRVHAVGVAKGGQAAEKQQVPPLHRRWRSGFGRNDTSKRQDCGTGTPSVRRRSSRTGERLFSRRTRYNSGCAIPFLI